MNPLPVFLRGALGECVTKERGDSLSGLIWGLREGVVAMLYSDTTSAMAARRAGSRGPTFANGIGEVGFAGRTRDPPGPTIVLRLLRGDFEPEAGPTVA